MGTRCKHVEEFLRKEKPHKHLIILMNKVDLIPTWLTVSLLFKFFKLIEILKFNIFLINWLI